MKKRKTGKQLVLNKRTIVSLNQHLLGAIRGGTDRKENEFVAFSDINATCGEATPLTTHAIVKNVTPNINN